MNTVGMNEGQQNHTLEPSEIRRRMVRYYSQSGEDCFIWNLLDFPDRGVFIDVGAFDGKYLSNSYSFAENGWDGICVEPLEQYAALCKQNQPRTVCINAACVGSDEISSVSFASEPLGVFSRLEVRAGDLEHLQDFYSKRDDHLEGFKFVEVPAVTVWSLVQQHFPGSPIDVLSIDVEGSEIEVLKGCRLDALRPRIICAEANTEEARLALDAFLVDAGYVHLRHMGVNHFYAADPVLIERAAGISIRCAVERQMHPMGARYSIPGMLSGQIIDESAQQARHKLQLLLQEEQRKNRMAVRLLQVACKSADPQGNFDNAVQDAIQQFTDLEETRKTLSRRIRELNTSLRMVQHGALIDTINHEDFLHAHWHVRVPSWLKRLDLGQAPPPTPQEPGHTLALLAVNAKDKNTLPIAGTTQISIEGFSFSANAALVAAMTPINPGLTQPNRIATDARNIRHLEACLRLGIPVFVPLVAPLESIVAVHLKNGSPLQESLQRWVRFHARLLRLVSAVTLLKAEDIAAHGPEIARQVLTQARIPLPNPPVLQPGAEKTGKAAAPVTAAQGQLKASDLDEAQALYAALLDSGRLLAVTTQP